MQENSFFENTFALFFSNSPGYIPAAFSCLGLGLWPAQRREGSVKYLNSGVVPPLPISRCAGGLGVTSWLILVGMQWERGSSGWIVTLCPSIATHQPSAWAILSLFLGEERRFPQRETDNTSRSKQNLPENNLPDPKWQLK